MTFPQAGTRGHGRHHAAAAAPTERTVWDYGLCAGYRPADADRRAHRQTDRYPAGPDPLPANSSPTCHSSETLSLPSQSSSS